MKYRYKRYNKGGRIARFFPFRFVVRNPLSCPFLKQGHREVDVDPYQLLHKYYPVDDPARSILLEHSHVVAAKAVAIARHLSASYAVDVVFVEEAALLHDIGIRFVYAPEIGCYGTLPYLAHGYKGRELLEAEGWGRHALVCERHIGVGLTAAEIREKHLALPERDMLPLSLEEQIIAYADLFYSKRPGRLDQAKGVEEIRHALARFGEEKVSIFDHWHCRFN